MKTENGDVAFWSCTENADYLTHTEVDDAVEAFLDRAPKLWPAQLVVHAYVREKVSAADREGAVDVGVESGMERFFENLDERYNCGDDCEPSDDDELKKELAVAFNRALERYFVWCCEQEPSLDVTIDTAAWVRAERPEWLTDAETAAWLAEQDAEKEEPDVEP